MKFWILLPACNEEASIPSLIPKIRKAFEEKKLDYQIVVIDDGSTDNTLAVLQELEKEYPIDIIKHPMNRGLGETERNGFEYIANKANDDDFLVRMDSDDTHDPKYIFDLYDKLNQGYDVVNTSRFQPGGGQKGVSVYRTIISYLANIFMKIIFRIDSIKDFSCGYRIYRVKIMKDAIRIFGNSFIQLKGLGFTSTLETIIKLNLLGCRFAEVPFVLRYDKKNSPSKMVSSITSLGYMIMAILYHWPFGGWHSFYLNLAKTYSISPEEAHRTYAIENVIRSTICNIGS